MAMAGNDPEALALLTQRTKMLEAFVPVGALPHYAAVVRPNHLPRTEVYCLFSRRILVQGSNKYGRGISAFSFLLSGRQNWRRCQGSIYIVASYPGGPRSKGPSEFGWEPCELSAETAEPPEAPEVGVQVESRGLT